MPVVGKLLKSSGAVFIRREWGNDELYKTVLEEYMATLLAEGSKWKRVPRVYFKLTDVTYSEL